MNSPLCKIALYFIIASLFSSECIAQYGGGFGGQSMMERARSERRFMEGYKKKKENGDNVDAYYRREVIFSFGLLSTTYKLDYVYSGGYSSSTGFTNFSGELETKVNGMNYGLGAGFYFPLSKVDEKSMIAIMTGLDFQYLKFKFTELRLNGGHKFTPEQNIVQLNVPVGIAYKTGTDAALRKSIKSGFSFGGGAMLGANIGLAEGVPTKYTMRPYGMAEMSFYTGFCWKIRAIGLLGNTTLLQGSQNVGIGGSGNETTMQLQSKGGIMLSLIFLTFSNDWDDD